MPEVRLFGSLRLHSPVDRLNLPGATVHEVLTALCDRHPVLCELIFQPDSELASFVRVTVNGRDIMLGRGLNTPLSETDSIAIFPPIAGGCGCLDKERS
jgi:molybdopterin synthase sulfur carrier subunit